VGLPLDTALTAAAAVTSLLLTGLIWVVALVVYPAFRLVGAADWQAYHRAHSRRITWAVAPPWAVQGLSALGLLALRPAALPLSLLLAHAALVAVPVAVTVGWSVPAHERLARGPDPAALRRLLVTNWLRVAGWTGSAVTGTASLLTI
jgi:hypothetical protein